MRQRSITILGLLLIIMVGMVSVSAVLYTNMYVTIEGDIPITGKTYCNIWLVDAYNSSNAVLLSPTGATFPLPHNISIINDGQIVRAMYYIKSNDYNGTQYVKVSINNSWFNDTTHPWYGFIYGLGAHGNGSHMPIITNQTFTLPPFQNVGLYVWFGIKNNMITPPGGYVHPTILIETI